MLGKLVGVVGDLRSWAAATGVAMTRAPMIRATATPGNVVTWTPPCRRKQVPISTTIGPEQFAGPRPMSGLRSGNEDWVRSGLGSDSQRRCLIDEHPDETEVEMVDDQH